MLQLRDGERDGPIRVAQRDTLRYPRLVHHPRRLFEHRRCRAKSEAPTDGPAAQPHSRSLRLVERASVLPIAVCGGARGSYTRGAGRVIICGGPRREVRDAREVQRASLIG